MNTTQEFCDDYERNAATADQVKYEVWFGEWALATDVCAHWLGGFNDGNTDPQFSCKWVDCPKTYMTDHGTDFDRTAATLGPFGTGNSTNVAIQNGKCSTDSDFFSQEEVQTIAKCALKSFDKHLNGTFFWTAHNEIEEKWDYVKAWDLGWLNHTRGDTAGLDGVPATPAAPSLDPALLEHAKESAEELEGELASAWKKFGHLLPFKIPPPPKKPQTPHNFLF